MQFDWTTFFLEILNFLVLIWLLKRFLYKPVLRMLDARQKRIHDQVGQADSMRAEAENLKAEYASRINDWQHEQSANRQNLAQELAQEREKHMAELKQALNIEREKAKARENATL
jgi:F-type H+-transporting ATPase subunit b